MTSLQLSTGPASLVPPTAAPGLVLSPRRVAIGIDGADVSGVALWRVPDRLSLRVEDSGSLVVARVVRVRAAGWAEADAIALLDELLGPGVEWIAAVERPWGKIRRAARRTLTAPPSYAEAMWRRALDLLARRRAMRAGLRYTPPQILRPYPQDWRAPLGVRTAGNTKAAALEYASRYLRLDIPDHNAAEAALIALFTARTAALPSLSAKLLGKKLGRATTVKFVP